ncbi:MAG TPA: phosphatase PAP2 family protein [Bacteroidia bacterium]|nr:phosphatase PAP2 family protein [Bacteroidia bacterium]
MQFKKIIFGILFSLISFSLFAQTDSTYVSKINKAYFKSYFTDTRDIILSPFHWNTKQWITVGATGAIASALIFTEDQNIHNLFQRNRSDLTNNISKYGLEPWGRGIYSMGTMAIFYSYGLLAKNNHAKETALLGLKTFIITGIGVNVAKYIPERDRPYVSDNPFMWYGPEFRKGDFSFPSGHSTSVFAMAAIVASEYHEYKIVPVIAYSIASLTALSRINDNKHWASDVFTGAVFGWAMGKLIYRNSHSKKGALINID